MCYYCRYLAHEKSISSDGDDHHQTYSKNIKYHSNRSCHLTIIIRLIILTSFFILFNLTIVLSQRDQSTSKNSQGKKIHFLMFTFENDFFLLVHI
jgi:hypothetical protein